MGMNKSVFSNVLFSETQKNILKLLYFNQNSDFHTNEIIRFSQSGTGAVQRELEKLTRAGLITVKQIGNQKRYQANQALSYYSELRSIIIKTFGLGDILNQELKRLFPTQIKIAFIYGSFAKQVDNPTSDIDLMLIAEDLTYADTFQVLNVIESTLGRKINPTFYSPSEWGRKYKEDNNFILGVLAQPKIFLIGTEDELTKLR
jgi:predicted nucleotidyltransferase